MHSDWIPAIPVKRKVSQQKEHLADCDSKSGSNYQQSSSFDMSSEEDIQPVLKKNLKMRKIGYFIILLISYSEHYTCSAFSALCYANCGIPPRESEGARESMAQSKSWQLQTLPGTSYEDTDVPSLAPVNSTLDAPANGFPCMFH